MTSLEDIVSDVKQAIIDAIPETKNKLNMTPWDKRSEVKNEAFSRKIEEKIDQKLHSSLPELIFRRDGKWMDDRYGVVAYTPQVLILIQVAWELRRNVGLRTVNSLEEKLSKTLRGRGGRAVLVFLATNRFVVRQAYAKFMSLKNRIGQGIEHAEIVNRIAKPIIVNADDGLKRIGR